MAGYWSSIGNIREKSLKLNIAENIFSIHKAPIKLVSPKREARWPHG